MDTLHDRPRAGERSASVALICRWGLLLMALASALLNVLAMVNWRPALDPSVAGHHGVSASRSNQPGWGRINRLEPGSPVEQAGGRVGDLVRFDHAGDFNFGRAMGVDESIGLTLRNAEGERHIVVKPIPKPRFSATEAAASWVLGWTNRWIALGIALLLALRACHQPGLRALALSMVVVSTWGDYFLPAGKFHDFFLLWLDPLRGVVSGLGFLYFTLRFGAAERSLWPHHAVRRTYAVLALLLVVYQLDDMAFLHGLTTHRAVEEAIGQWAAGVLDPYIACGLLSLVALIWSWRHSLGLERERVGWVALALGLFLSNQLQFALSFMLDWTVPHRFLWLDLATCVSLALLAYAVVRHRVFDIGFVLNRVLVFSVASAIVVAARVVLDWAARKGMHVASADAGIAVDAAITLVLVLLFMPLQRIVGDRVTRIFFRQWEAAAEQLRAFVERAPHVTDAGELRRKLLAAIDAYGGSGGSAFYVQDGNGYLRAESTLEDMPQRITENDDAAVELRRAQGAVVLGDLGTEALASPAALALPMTVRGRLSAFVLVGHKPQQELFRPDEVALLARSVRTLGLDLEALRIEELERANAASREEIQRLRFALESWRTGLASRGAAG
jgi:hypothetical protein